MSNLDLKKRIVVVTGACGSIGRALTDTFCTAGEIVVVADIDDDACKAIADAVTETGGQALGIAIDVSRADRWDRLVATVLARFERVDVLVNNAGITQAGSPMTADLPEEQFDRIVSVNLKGTWLGMKSVIPSMIRQGGGIIVNIASTAGLVGTPGYCAYSATKHGVLGLTRTAALEYGGKGIRINAVCPGVMASSMNQRGREPSLDREARAREIQPALGRSVMPAEIAATVAFLASDAAYAIRGEEIAVDGGYRA